MDVLVLLGEGSSFRGESESGVALGGPHMVWGLAKAPLVHRLQAYAVHQHSQFTWRWLLSNTWQPLMLCSWRCEWVARQRRPRLQPRHGIKWLWRNSFIGHVN